MSFLFSINPNQIIRYFLLSLLVITIALGGSDTSLNAQDEDVRRAVYGLTLLPSGIDPHINQSAELGIPLRSVYDTLVYRHPQTLAFEAGLAESWEISDDGTVYTFSLKEGVTFHDGQPFDAAAVGVNFDRVNAEETASQKAKGLLGPFYVGYTILNEFTFQIRLSAPYEPLLDGLSQVYLGIASPLALANYADGTYQWHQVGTGPYSMVETIPGESILLRRNPDYAWGPIFYTTDNPNPIEEVEFRFFTDPATRDDALQSGEVDFIGELLPLDSELLLGNNDLRIYPVAIPGQPLQFIFNLNRVPTNDVNVRKALLYATNRVAIVDAVFAGQSPVANAPLTAVTQGFTDRTQDQYSFDPQEAEDLFRLAGIADTDEDGILDLNGVPLEITIVAPPWGLIPLTAQAIEGQWRELGIQVMIEQVPNFGALLGKINDGEYNMLAFYSFGLDASLLNSYYLANGFNNIANFNNPEVDELLTQALQESDPTTRDNLYAAAQAIIMEEAIILPVRDYVNLNGATASIDGVIFDAHGWFPLLHNFQWAD